MANPPKVPPKKDRIFPFVFQFNGRVGRIKSWPSGLYATQIARWKKLTNERVAYEPFQEIENHFPGISRAAFEAGVQLIESGGRIFSGADAVFRTLDYARPQPKILWLRKVPGFMAVARFAYNFIAKRRAFFSRFS